MSMTAYKDSNDYRSCQGNWTEVNIDVAWNSESLHNGAELVIMDSVPLAQSRRC